MCADFNGKQTGEHPVAPIDTKKIKTSYRLCNDSKEKIYLSMPALFDGTQKLITKSAG